MNQQLIKGFSSILSVIILLMAMLGIGVTAYVIKSGTGFQNFAQEPVDLSVPTSVSYGINTHVSFTPGYSHNLHTFKQQVDDMVEKKQSWIRFGPWDWDIAPSGSADKINWQNLDKLDEAVFYAKNKGLKIFFVTNVPLYAKDYSLADYLKVTQLYYGFLSQRYAYQINIWQIFNEANTHNYRDYSPTKQNSDAYLYQLNKVVAQAASSIKANKANSKTTMNVAGWPINDEVEKGWFTFFDSLKTNLDYISLDLYPDKYTDLTIEKPGQRINDMKLRYNKAVIVAETGICTATGNYTEQDQKTDLPIFINELKKGLPKIIMLYEYQDEPGITDGCEKSFGIKRVDGTKKPAYYEVVKVMNNP